MYVRLSIALRVLVTLLAFSAWGSPARAERERAPFVGIDEKLGDYLPMDLGFRDAQGDSVYLRDVFERPTILTLVYYHCPTICKPLLTNVADVVDRTDLVPGADYDLVTVSFDEMDTPQTALVMKRNITSSLRLEDGAWRFLTADPATIERLTAAVGFGVERREKDFAHGAALIVLSPEGKIVRYLYGLEYGPFDVKMAVREASRGQVTPTIARVLQFCFSFDPEGRRYVFNATRVAGASVLLLALGWVVYMAASGRARKGRADT